MNLSNNYSWDDSQCVVSDQCRESPLKNSVYEWHNSKNILLVDKGHVKNARESYSKDKFVCFSMIFPKANKNDEIDIILPTPRLGCQVEKINLMNKAKRLKEFKDLKNCSSCSYPNTINKNKDMSCSWVEKCKVCQKLSSPRILDSIKGRF
ncbi:unnamed protein product [Moneuplotes crassus]|uniref:Uncharacterized protein n=1 Tax=Euplotes crassus TaxID=5936 RepID=A0AAD1X631_EUPCR|nr:unnamed protein product [Moneuplotes crassus]